MWWFCLGLGRNSMKICFTASSGGHIEEISRLHGLKKENNIFLFTEKSNCGEIDWCNQVYFVNQVNRTEWKFIFKFIVLLIKSFLVLKKENPDVIISTGALITVPICLWGKILHKKIIYIESFARVNKSSLTGKLMYRVADLFIVQWREMLNIFPDATYCGGML